MPVEGSLSLQWGSPGSCTPTPVSLLCWAVWPKPLWIQGDSLELGTELGWGSQCDLSRSPRRPGAPWEPDDGGSCPQDWQRGLWILLCRPAGHSRPFPVIPGVPLPRCAPGGSPGMSRAAGSARSSCTRWIPARTPIPTSSPRRRPATSTRSSVSAPAGRKAGTGGLAAPLTHGTPVPGSFPRSQPLSPVPAVHNVKPECLEAYNKLT